MWRSGRAESLPLHYFEQIKCLSCTLVKSHVDAVMRRRMLDSEIVGNRSLLVESYQRRVRHSPTNDQSWRAGVGIHGAEGRNGGRDNAF
jgi:hypothetical protein